MSYDGCNRSTGAFVFMNLKQCLIFLLWFSGKPLYQSGGSSKNTKENSSDWPWGQMSSILHGNQKLLLHYETMLFWRYQVWIWLILFFSPLQWLSVLDIIAKALFDNNMEFSQINGIHKFQVSIFVVAFWCFVPLQLGFAATGQVSLEVDTAVLCPSMHHY